MLLQEFGNEYVTKRGIPPEFALIHGIDETKPQPDIIRARLRWASDDSQIEKAFEGVASLLWFPLPNGNEEVLYNARVNGTLINQEGKPQRFLSTKGGRHASWIPGPTRAVSDDPSVPIIIIEGPFKGLATLHAGGLPIGVVGSYFNEPVSQGDEDKFNNRVLNRDIAAFKLRTRPVYLAFDVDQFQNAQVRSGVIRGAIMLRITGAEVFQLTWPLEFRGLDDYLGKGIGLDPEKQKAALRELTRV